MPIAPKPTVRLLLLGTAMILLGACGTNSLDWDLRQPGSSLDTTSAAQGAAAARPQPDSRGVISYSTYQVAVAQRGDSVAGLASRIGLGADEVARYNGLQADTVLRTGEVLALPRRVDAAGSASSPSALQPGGGPGSAPGSAIDITTLAAGAIERAGATATPVSSQPQGVPGREPIRHQVLRGETSYSIARLYNVSPKALADWNGLGPDLAVREGQFLLIPVPGEAALEAATAASESAPGQGSATPVPPSAATPLPEENPEQTAATITPPSPNLATGQTSASAGQFAYPADGSIIRAYAKGKNEGIDIGAVAGSTVRAAADGTVAAITEDTDQVPILVIRHADNLLTVYANIDGIKVAKGAAVKRGQSIATVRAGTPSFVHFEVRQGFESVDPTPYLQ